MTLSHIAHRPIKGRIQESVVVNPIVIANYAWAILWTVIGIIFTFCAIGSEGRARVKCLVVSAAFVLFGVSDVIEVETGAWWRPWWLLVWKVCCVATLVLLFFGFWKGTRRVKECADESREGPY
ncbi:MAG: hypothetical protein MI923_02535 [Phycisphaerales bacterium]|nr:hypothetical protein [Phycisphaerales bacterium]